MRDEFEELQRKILAYVFFNGRERALQQAMRRLQPCHFEKYGLVLWKVFVHYFTQTQGMPDLEMLRQFFRAKKAKEDVLFACEQYLIDMQSVVADVSESSFLWFIGRLEDVYRQIKFEEHTEESIVRLHNQGYAAARDYLYGSLGELESSYIDLAPDGLIQTDIDDFITEVAHAKDNRYVSAVDFGFPTLDRDVLGLRGGDMVLIVGWTGVGKTTLCINTAVHTAFVQKKNAVIITTETIRQQLRRRIYSRITRLPAFQGYVPLSSHILKRGDLNSDEQQTLLALKNFLNSGSHGMLMITQAPSRATMDWLRGKLLQYESQFRIDLLIVDDIRNMTPSMRRKQEYEEIAQLLRDLKRIARTHANRGIPILSPYHINRETFKKFMSTEGSQTVAMSLAGLASSSEAERLTDIGILLWQDPNQPSRLEVNVLKMRDGKSGQKFNLTTDLDFQYLEESSIQSTEFLSGGLE